MVADELAEAARKVRRLEEELVTHQDARVVASDRAKAAADAVAGAFNSAAERIEGITKKLNQSLGNGVAIGVSCFSTSPAGGAPGCLGAAIRWIRRPFFRRAGLRRSPCLGEARQCVALPVALAPAKHYIARAGLRGSTETTFPGALRSYRELSLAGLVGPVIWRPPTTVGSRDHALTAIAAPHFSHCHSGARLLVAASPDPSRKPGLWIPGPPAAGARNDGYTCIMSEPASHPERKSRPPRRRPGAARCVAAGGAPGRGRGDRCARVSGRHHARHDRVRLFADEEPRSIRSRCCASWPMPARNWRCRPSPGAASR